MDSVALETGGKDPVEVGYAAVEALHTAVADEEFDPSAIDVSLTDEDVDAYGHDTAFAAAADYAGGATWMPNSDASKRREFWQWWRAFAIPAAWWAVWQPERGTLQHLLTAPSASQTRQRQHTPKSPLKRGVEAVIPLLRGVRGARLTLDDMLVFPFGVFPFGHYRLKSSQAQTDRDSFDRSVRLD